MAFPMVAAFAVATVLLPQESAVPPPPRVPLPRPVANAPLARVNDNRRPAGSRSGKTLTLSLDVIEAAYQPEGEHDPVVRVLAFAESGKAPQVPGPMLRAPVGTTVRLTLRNRSDSAIMMGGLRRSLPEERDTLNIAPGATREITFRLDKVGNFFYWAGLKRLSTFTDREWLDSQLNGAFIVDSARAPAPSDRERVWLITEWFHPFPKTQTFESALTFNGKAWPYNERLNFTQGDSVHFRIINAAAVEHPLHLHGFYFRVARSGGARADTVVPTSLQPLQNMRIVPIGGSLSLSFLPTTPGNWVFHCHFASHVGEVVSLHDSPDAFTIPSPTGDHAMPAHDMPGGHTMRGLVIGMHIAPAPGYKEPVVGERRLINLLIQKRRNALVGGQTAYGFLLQTDTTTPARDSIQLPGPVLELKRGQPVRILVKNHRQRCTARYDARPSHRGRGRRAPRVLQSRADVSSRERQHHTRHVTYDGWRDESFADREHSRRGSTHVQIRHRGAGDALEASRARRCRSPDRAAWVEAGCRDDGTRRNRRFHLRADPPRTHVAGSLDRVGAARCAASGNWRKISGDEALISAARLSQLDAPARAVDDSDERRLNTRHDRHLQAEHLE
jgi:FtsP/CotA-like multicopper oxidase with cupredoxin domain